MTKTRGIIFIISLLFSLALVGCGGGVTTKIEDNLSAYQCIKVGMSTEEISPAVKKGYHFAVINFESFTPGNPSTYKVAPGIDGPYYAWGFPPIITSGSQPTMAIFDGKTNKVIVIAKVDCAEALRMIATQGGLGPFGACKS